MKKGAVCVNTAPFVCGYLLYCRGQRVPDVKPCAAVGGDGT